MTNKFSAPRIILTIGVVGLLSSSRALAQGDGCPDSGDAGNTTPVLTIYKSDNTCQVTEGMYAKKWAAYRVDLEATATGYCNVYTTPPGCPLYQTQLRTLAASTIKEQVPNGTTYILKVLQAEGQVQYYNTVGPINTQTGASWNPFYVGAFVIKNSTSVSPTACGFSPSVYPSLNINVNLVSGFHKGTPCDGSLDGGTQLGENGGTGYTHYHGGDPVGFQDTWAVSEHLIQVIKNVGAAWNPNHSSQRMGFGDMSDPGGGPMSGHVCHENGLEVDVRYVKATGEGPIDLIEPDMPTYSKTKTIELLQSFMNSGLVNLIYVHPNSGITPTDVPGVVVDPSTTHRDHFHVRLTDPDGPDSNNC